MKELALCSLSRLLEEAGDAGAGLSNPVPRFQRESVLHLGCCYINSMFQGGGLYVEHLLGFDK